MPIQLTDPTTIISGIAMLGTLLGGAFLGARQGGNGNTVRLKHIDRLMIETRDRVERILDCTKELEVRVAVIETKLDGRAG